MSHFVECQTEFRDPQALIASLVECGFEKSQIEIHDEAVQLYGYQGDERPERAHIVIRRQHVGRRSTLQPRPRRLCPLGPTAGIGLSG